MIPRFFHYIFSVFYSSVPFVANAALTGLYFSLEGVYLFGGVFFSPLCYAVRRLFYFFTTEVLSIRFLLKTLFAVPFLCVVPFRIAFYVLETLYNSISFLFLFLTSLLFVVCDLLVFFVRFLVVPALFRLRLLRLRILSRLPYSLGLYLEAPSRLTGYLSAFLALFVLVFSEPAFFSGYLAQDIGRDSLDSVTHGLVGAWYSSNWWYFRLWFFYIFVYLLFPSSRLVINENILFILGFPMLLKFLDILGSAPHSFVEDHLFSFLGGLIFVQLASLTYGLTGFSPQFSEAPGIDSTGFPLVKGLDGQELGEDYNYEERNLPEATSSYSFFSPLNPETTNTRAGSILFDLDYLHKQATRRYGNLFLRQLMVLPYGMDVGELEFKANDLSETVPGLDIYFDEAYYLRSIDELAQPFLIDRITRHYFDLNRYEYFISVEEILSGRPVKKKG